MAKFIRLCPLVQILKRFTPQPAALSVSVEKVHHTRLQKEKVLSGDYTQPNSLLPTQAR